MVELPEQTVVADSPIKAYLYKKTLTYSPTTQLMTRFPLPYSTNEYAKASSYIQSHTAHQVTW
jgi:hypothetical protein